jgi:IS30 family transposase
MPKRYLPEFRERAVRMVLDHAEDYGPTTAACNAGSSQLGISREALRRWVNQAQVDAGTRPGISTAESGEVKALKAENKRLREANEILRQALYIEGRGALKRELVACLRTGRALRKPRERSRNKPQGHVTAEVVLSERPAEAEDRAVPGHWEGDLIIGLNRPAIGTVVERTSRYTLLVHLPRLEGGVALPRRSRTDLPPAATAPSR